MRRTGRLYLQMTLMIHLLEEGLRSNNQWSAEDRGQVHCLSSSWVISEFNTNGGKDLIMSILGVIFVAAFTLFVCAAAFVRWRFSYWRRRGIPYLPPSFPYGNTKDALLGTRPFAIAMDEIYKKVQDLPFAGIFKSLHPSLMLTDLELIRDVMIRDALLHFIDRPSESGPSKDVIFAKTVFSANSAHWRIVRTNLSPAFSSGKMKMIFPFLQQKARILNDKLEEVASLPDPRVDMKFNFARLATDFLASSSFGIETNSLNDPENELLKNGLKIVEKTYRRSFNIAMAFQFPSLIKYTRALFIPEDVQIFFRHLVWGVVNETEKKGYKRGNYLDLLIQLKNKGKNQTDEKEENKREETEPTFIDHFDGDDLVAHAFIFYFAGFETTSSALNFALLELAANQDCQEKLIEEIDNTFGENEEISYEELHGMKYLDMVVNETLRKYPVLAVLSRVCRKEYHYPKLNLVIPKGMEVLIPVYSIQRDPRYYPNPEKFDPERFSSMSNVTNYTFMPFGDGPRFCIGKRLGIMEVKMGLVSVLTKFHFHLPKELEGMKAPPLDKKSFFVTPEFSLRLIIKRRTHTHSRAQIESRD